MQKKSTNDRDFSVYKNNLSYNTGFPEKATEGGTSENTENRIEHKPSTDDEDNF